MKILGIDPGLRVCGYAVLQTGESGDNLVEAGVFKSNGKLPLEQRLNQIAEDIDNIIGRTNPSLVSVEELYSHYEHPKTSILMGHARGVILQKCGQADIQVKSFSATKIKKSLTGNGRAGKDQMQRAIQIVLGLEDVPEPHDVADAIAAALCCREHMKALEFIAGENL